MISDIIRPGPERMKLLLRWSLVWTGVVLLAAAQGYLFAALEGTPQPWWATLGYVAATMSIWVALSPLLIALVRRVEAARQGRALKLAIYAAALIPALIVQVILFVAIFYPVYSGGPGVMDRPEMASRSFVANLNTNAAVYLGLVLAGWRTSRRDSPSGRGRDDSPQAPDIILQGRCAGRHQLVPLAEVDWIEAAGDYAEVHAGNRSILIDDSLSRLSIRLPEGAFARVHRGAIVRLDRVREVRSLGRGDAMLTLKTGTEVRLSRRYRAKVLERLSI